MMLFFRVFLQRHAGESLSPAFFLLCTEGVLFLQRQILFVSVDSFLGLSRVVLHKVVCVVPRHAVHVGYLVAELDAVELARVLQQLRPGKK